MRGPAHLLAAAVLAVACAQPSEEAQAPTGEADLRERVDVSALGPQVGEVVPDFSLNDAAGRTWTRDTIMGPRGAMLVFVRSAEW